MLERLPNELLLEILNWLVQDGETSGGGLCRCLEHSTFVTLILPVCELVGPYYSEACC